MCIVTAIMFAIDHRYGSILSGDTPSYRNVNTFGFQDILDWLHSRDPSRSAVEVKSNHSGDVNPFLNLPVRFIT